MWVFLRLLTAVFVGVVRFFWRRTHVQEKQESHGIPWVIHRDRGKYRVIATRFGLPLRSPLFLTFTREGKLDGLFKGIGLSHEIQTGDPEFDREIYIACDDPALLPALRDHRKARDGVRLLFGQGVTRIYTDGACLWAKRGGDSPPDAEALGALNDLADALRSVPAQTLPILRDAYFWKSLVVTSLVWSLAFYGVPMLLERGFEPNPLYFDWGQVIWAGVYGAILIFAGLILTSWLLLRGSSRAHRVFVESAVVLLLGVPFSSIAIVADVNVYLDRSEAALVEPVVTQKYITITHGRHGSHTHYHLATRLLNGSAGVVPARFEVGWDLYRSAIPGGKIAVYIRSGALGLPWVESIRAE